ncbi:MAG: hypothetical protein QW757_05120 [Candidatus Woesearchaeota archaeon]
MLKKQKNLLKISFLLFVSLLIIDFVSAQTTYRALKPFWDFIAYIFSVLPSGTTKYVFYKFIIWMLLASVLILLVPNSLAFLRSEDPTVKKNAKIIAWILSLMMSIGIPNSILDLIFNSYSLIGAFLLLAVGPALIFALTNKSNRRLRGIAFLVSGVLLMIFATTGTVNEWLNLWDLLDWINLGGFIMMIIGIIMIIMGDEKTNTGSEKTEHSQNEKNSEHNNENNSQHKKSEHHETFEKEKAKNSLHLIDEILNEINEFNNKLVEKIRLIEIEINDYRNEIKILEELLQKIKELKERISHVSIINDHLSDEQAIKELKEEIENKLNLGSGHNITTAIRDLKTLEKHLSTIDQHIVELQRKQNTLITKSKNNLWNVDNSLEGQTSNQDLANLIQETRHLIRDIASKIDQIKRIEHLNERAESQIIEQNKNEIIQGSNIDSLINAIKTLCGEVINKKENNKLNSLKTNITHLLHFLETQPNHSSPGGKIAHKLRIHETLQQISRNINEEGKISDEIIKELDQLKQQLQVISKE